MSEWIITHLTEPTPESTFEEKGLPANKQVWGILRDFVGTHPAGQGAPHGVRRGGRGGRRRGPAMKAVRRGRLHSHSVVCMFMQGWPS